MFSSFYLKKHVTATPERFVAPLYPGSFFFSPVFPLALLCGTTGCPGTILSLLDVGASYRCWIWIVAPLGALLRIIAHLCFTVKKYVFSHQHLLQPQQFQLALCVCLCYCQNVETAFAMEVLPQRQFWARNQVFICNQITRKNCLCTKTTWVVLGKLGV